MRHHDNKRKFGRTSNGRRALLRSLAEGLILHGRITTTEARAKELRPFVEKLVTHGREGTVAKRRLINTQLGGRDAVTKKLVDEIAPKYKDRAGGYTRVVKLPQRSSDAAHMAVIEFV